MPVYRCFDSFLCPAELIPILEIGSREANIIFNDMDRAFMVKIKSDKAPLLKNDMEHGYPLSIRMKSSNSAYFDLKSSNIVFFRLNKS